MLQLRPIINRIKVLLDEDTDASVTYAALEARLALEKVVYDRLRQRHDYISHAQLNAWKPGHVVKRLLAEVDEHMSETLVLSMSHTPHVPGVKPEDEDYLQIGVEIGVDAKRMAGMWQALSNLALHARMPKNKSDRITEYGDRKSIRAKVEQVIAELERLAKSTMSFSGIPVGGDVSFDCTCGEKNKRRAKLLRDGQHVFCINPECIETWKVVVEGTETNFENVLIDVPCKVCSKVNHIPWRMVTEMKYDQMIEYPCVECGGKNVVKWQLVQATFPPNPD
jgi:hypothetical protein